MNTCVSPDENRVLLVAHVTDGIAAAYRLVVCRHRRFETLAISTSETGQSCVDIAQSIPRKGDEGALRSCFAISGGNRVF